MDDRADVAAFIDNIGDTRYRTTAFDLAGSFGSVESQIGFPRTYGIELGYKW
jgi:outer membrane receptor protein involved in Fe transport